MSRGETFDERMAGAHLYLTEPRTKRLREGWTWVELMLERLQQEDTSAIEVPAVQHRNLPVPGVEVVR